MRTINTEKFLGLTFILAGLLYVLALYPLPVESLFEVLAGDEELNFLQKIGDSLWISWLINCLLGIGSVYAGVAAVRHSRNWATWVLGVSVLFIAVWWYHSGLFDGENSFFVQAMRRWISWPKLVFQRGEILGFAKILMNDYVLFSLYHFSALFLTFNAIRSLRGRR
jgi:hypothetical protein